MYTSIVTDESRNHLQVILPPPEHLRVNKIKQNNNFWTLIETKRHGILLWPCGKSPTIHNLPKESVLLTLNLAHRLDSQN